MRKIGYRIWVDNEMEDVKMLNLIRETATIASYSGGVDVSYKNNPIMQYAGLKDKNDVEICEGDIVKTPNGLSVISYDPPRFVASNEYDDCFVGFSGEWEVVGTIYENPELLKP